MSAADVLLLLREIGQLLGLGLQLVDLARQLRPELRTEPLPDAAAEMRDARAAAADRTDSEPDR